MPLLMHAETPRHKPISLSAKKLVLLIANQGFSDLILDGIVLPEKKKNIGWKTSFLRAYL